MADIALQRLALAFALGTGTAMETTNLVSMITGYLALVTYVEPQLQVVAPQFWSTIWVEV